MFRLLQCSRLMGTRLSINIISSQSEKAVLVHSARLTQLHSSCAQRCLHSSRTQLSDDTQYKQPLVVYRGPLTGQMKRLKVFSLFTSGVGMYVAPTVMAEMSKAGMGIAIMMGSVMGIFTLMTPALIHMVVRNYVTRLEYDAATDKYTACTITLLLRTRTVTFGVDEVEVPDIPGMFTTFVVRGKSLFADANSFEPIEHFGRIMGYDRPVDLKLTKRPPAPPSPPGGPTPQA